MRSGFSCLIYSVHTFFEEDGLEKSKLFFFTTSLFSIKSSFSSHNSVLMNGFLYVDFFLNGNVIPGNKIILDFCSRLVDLGLFLPVDFESLKSLAFTFGL